MYLIEDLAELLLELLLDIVNLVVELSTCDNVHLSKEERRYDENVSR